GPRFSPMNAAEGDSAVPNFPENNISWSRAGDFKTRAERNLLTRTGPTGASAMSRTAAASPIPTSSPGRSPEEPSHPLDRHTNTTVALGASQQLAISQGSATDPDH